jgi:hypothetical protein
MSSKLATFDALYVDCDHDAIRHADEPRTDADPINSGCLPQEKVNVGSIVLRLYARTLRDRLRRLEVDSSLEPCAAGYWGSRRRWPRAKTASRQVPRIPRLDTALVEVGGVSCCTTVSLASRSPALLAAIAASVEASGASCRATGSALSRSAVWLVRAVALVAAGTRSCSTTGLGAQVRAMCTSCHA